MDKSEIFPMQKNRNLISYGFACLHIYIIYNICLSFEISELFDVYLLMLLMCQIVTNCSTFPWSKDAVQVRSTVSPYSQDSWIYSRNILSYQFMLKGKAGIFKYWSTDVALEVFHLGNHLLNDRPVWLLALFVDLNILL